MLTKVRTLFHEEISLLTVLYFSFRARTPTWFESAMRFRAKDFKFSVLRYNGDMAG